MATIKESRKAKIKAFFAKYSKFTKAAAILVLAFFVLGACTIGGFNSPGGAYFAEEDTTVAIYLDYNKNESGSSVALDKVYLNVGAMYEDIGSDVTLTFRHASATLTTLSWSTTGLGSLKIGNLYSQSGGVTNANYNWIKAFDLTESGKTVSTTRRIIQISFPSSMVVNEVVFVDKDGNVIPAYTDRAEVEKVFADSSKWTTYRDLFASNDKYEGVSELLDAQNNYRTGSSAYFNFTQDEMYTLMQIDGILIGKHTTGDNYITSTDFGPLAPLLSMVGVAIFGKSLFGLRIMSVLFTAALVGLAYLFGKCLFKSEGFGFLLACLFAGGGLALTVGRLGLAYSFLAFFVVAAYYFMFKFFEDGISEDAPVHSALNILFSGLMFALAVAVDPKAVFAAIGLIALFVFGAVKQSRAHKEEARAIRKEMSDKNLNESSEEVMQANIDECERKERVLSVNYSYKLRITYAFLFISFIVATVLFYVLASIPSYYSYVRLYEANPESPTLGIFRLIGYAIKDAFTVSDVTAFSSGNAMSAFGWFIGLKGATLFSASSAKTYMAINAQLNLAMIFTGLIGFIFASVYAILYAITGGKGGTYGSEHAGKAMRAYAVLALGLLTSLLQYAFAGNVSATQGFLFDFFYIGFIVLTFYISYMHDTSRVSRVFGIRMNTTLKVLAGILAVYAVIFLLSVPMYFGIPISTLAATICFGWTTFLSNGYYRF